MIDVIPDKHTLVQLIDDCAAILQNPTYYGIVLRAKPSGSDNQGIPFRDKVITQLEAISPSKRPQRAANRNLLRGELVVPAHVVRKANDFLRQRPRQGGWPDDEWHTLNDSWDLNLYIEDRTIFVAAIYSVTSGQTHTGKWWEIYRTGGWYQRKK